MKRLVLAFIVICLIGCAHVVSKEFREGAQKEIDTKALFRDPEAYRGKAVILGGIIISSMNTDEGTYIEVLQRPLNHQGRPKDADESYGRFLVFSEEYIETAIYSRGKELTVAGQVMGKRVRPLGDIQYSYLLIKGMELHLFKPRYGPSFRFGIGIIKTF